jgi:tRNA dimethylallyltransferase
MFVDALCFGIDEIESDEALRAELIQHVDDHGTEGLLKELEAKDPIFFNKVDKANPVRIIRAIQVIRSTGKPYSEQRTGRIKKHDFEIRRFIIEHPREQLYKRIEQRVDLMMQEGLLEEVKSVRPYRDLNALRTVGYKELFDYLDGTVNLDKAIELIKQHTRNYAKRQMTWFRRYTDAKQIVYAPTEEMVNVIINELVD